MNIESTYRNIYDRDNKQTASDFQQAELNKLNPFSSI